MIWAIFFEKISITYTRRYGPLLGLRRASAFGRGFFALPAKKLIMLFWPILGHFWCPVVPFVTFSSNLSNLEKIPQKPKTNTKNKKKKK